MGRICIYMITNSVNDKVYIGSTTDYDRRESQHKKLLSLSKHDNKRLNADVKLYGADVFHFSVLSEFEDLPTLWLRYIEAVWIEYFRHHFELYNVNFNTTGFGLQKFNFDTREERIAYRRVAKIEKFKANNYVIERIKKVQSESEHVFLRFCSFGNDLELTNRIYE